MNPLAIVALIGVQVALHYIGKYLAGSGPDTASKFLSDQPTANEGSPIGMVFGRVRIRNPTLYWYGGLVHRTNLGVGSPITLPSNRQPNYGLNMLLCLGIPMGPTAAGGTNGAELLGMWVGDLKLDLALTHGNSVRTGPLNLDFVTSGLANDWSDPTVAGEVWCGLISFYGGASDQVLTDYTSSSSAPTFALDVQDGSDPEFAYYPDITPIATFMRVNADTRWRSVVNGIGGTPAIGSTPTVDIDPTTIPGYRNQMLVSLTGDVAWHTGANGAGDNTGFSVYEAFFVGNQAALPSFSFEVRSVRVQFDAGWSAVDDCDPASAIYEVLTNDLCGVGLAATAIDSASFHAASTTLLAEGNGYSRVFDQATDAKTMLQEIVAQASGALYQDSSDGLIKFKLVRGGYVIADLPTFGPDEIIEVTSYVTGSWHHAVNQTRAKFYERFFDYNVASAPAQNMGGAVMEGTINGDVTVAAGSPRPAEIEYPGCAVRANAIKLADRDLNLLAQPLGIAQFTINRAAKNLRPGDAFVVNLPTYYLSNSVWRVTNNNLGELADNRCVIDCTQDPFANGGAAAFPSPL